MSIQIIPGWVSVSFIRIFKDAQGRHTLEAVSVGRCAQDDTLTGEDQLLGAISRVAQLTRITVSSYNFIKCYQLEADPNSRRDVARITPALRPT